MVEVIKQNILTPSMIAIAIKHMRTTAVSLYVHGAPGISKSAVARQVADSLNIAFIDFRLTSVAPEDVRGVPFLDDAGGMRGLIWTPPLVFPRDLDLAGTLHVDGAELVRFYNPIGNNKIHYCTQPQITVECLEPGKTPHIGEHTLDSFVVTVTNRDGEIVPGKVLWRVTGAAHAILGLEEFNSATPSVMAAAYQLILDRRMGDYVVPDGVMLLAMGNRRGDKGVTFEIPKPVANRFIHLEMQVDFDDWLVWALEQHIHADVIGYLSKWKSHLFDEAFAKKPEQSFATPRSWEFVSKAISQTAPVGIIKALVCGAIGDVIGTQFVSHRAFMADMPNVETILNGSVTSFAPAQADYRVQIAYSTCVQMCYALKGEMDAVSAKYHDELTRRNSKEHQRWTIRADNAIGYVLDNFNPEVITIFHRMALLIYRLRFNTSSMSRYREFATMFSDSILVNA